MKKQRFPGAGAKGRTITVPMRELDPGFNDNNKRTRLKTGELQTFISPENDSELLRSMRVLFDFTVRPGAFSYGYDLDIRQAGRSVTRLRVTGRCTRTAGSMECKRKKVKLTP